MLIAPRHTFIPCGFCDGFDKYPLWGDQTPDDAPKTGVCDDCAAKVAD